jgi:hypothetical protein
VEASARLAWRFRAANDRYASDYPTAVGFHMTHTDSTPFMNEVPVISLRENERGMQIGAGWNPHWHQPSDLYSSYSDKDFLPGLNPAQTTLAAIARRRSDGGPMQAPCAGARVAQPLLGSTCISDRRARLRCRGAQRSEEARALRSRGRGKPRQSV